MAMATDAARPRRQDHCTPVTLCLCGDVMTGRGVDQVLPHPCAPGLFEPYVKDAGRYVEFAEAVHGPIPKPVDFSYIWGDALEALHRVAPDVRLVNLETAVTCSEDAWPGKGIHYRMHPANFPCITAAGIDCCVLANNHVLDWGYDGLAQTLATLQAHGVRPAGAGRDAREAGAPAVIPVPDKGRVVVLAFGVASSGIPAAWAAAGGRPGVNLLQELTPEAAGRVGSQVRALRRPGDRVVVSIHWGGNWGYDIGADRRDFAHRLIDAGVDLVHGHSSHHALGIEVHRERLILYGCGDFINDYEGIPGYEPYRPDLGLMYFASLAQDGRLEGLRMLPVRVNSFRARRASSADARWLRETLTREGAALGTRVLPGAGGLLELRW